MGKKEEAARKEGKKREGRKDWINEGRREERKKG